MYRAAHPTHHRPKANYSQLCGGSASSAGKAERLFEMALLVDPERAPPTLAPSGPPIIGLPGRVCPRPYDDAGVDDDDDDAHDHHDMWFTAGASTASASAWGTALFQQPSQITENHAGERVAKKKYV